MPSRSLTPNRSPSRGRTRTPASNARSISPRRSASRSPSRSGSRDRTPRSRTNGDRRSYTRSPSRRVSRSPSRNGQETRRRSRSASYSRSRSRSQSPPMSTKIVVEKLTKNINEDHLREIFGAYGDITEVDLPMNKHFNTNRGTAYIVYASISDAETAIAHMHEAQIDGAVINVAIVLPKRRFSRSPPPRRGGFGPRFESRGGLSGPPAYRDPPPGAGRGRYRSPPRRGGYGRGGRGENWRGGRAYSRSRSPRRSRSRSYSSRSRSRSRSRSPPRIRGGGYRARDSPPPRSNAATVGGRRRRSPSYSSYGSYSSRSRSRSRDRRRR